MLYLNIIPQIASCLIDNFQKSRPFCRDMALIVQNQKRQYSDETVT